MRAVVGEYDVLLVTLDTLRYDVAADACAAGRTPNLTALLPGGRWELRHSPASFTYAAHQAFFAGFLPTPARPGRHARLFALRFEGSDTTTEKTCVFDAPDIVTGLRARGYHTACIGGTGFFNKRNPLGNVLPSLFDESHWDPSLGVRDPRSTENQVARAVDVLRATPRDRRIFLFVNISALHQPNHFYIEGATTDSLETHAAALAYVDRALPPLFDALRERGGAFCIVSSDHGTAYGEEGFHGHRLAHPTVWNVPYAEFMLPPR
jgi:arylsulfatase A-like enzyme